MLRVWAAHTVYTSWLRCAGNLFDYAFAVAGDLDGGLERVAHRIVHGRFDADFIIVRGSDG